MHDWQDFYRLRSRTIQNYRDAFLFFSIFSLLFYVFFVKHFFPRNLKKVANSTTGTTTTTTKQKNKQQTKKENKTKQNNRELFECFSDIFHTYCVCVCARARMCVYVCVCVWEREREVFVCDVCVCVCVLQIVCHSHPKHWNDVFENLSRDRCMIGRTFIAFVHGRYKITVTRFCSSPFFPCFFMSFLWNIFFRET